MVLEELKAGDTGNSKRDRGEGGGIKNEENKPNKEGKCLEKHIRAEEELIWEK